MFERFTDRARQAVVDAQQEARSLHHNYIGTEHLLLALTGQRHSVAGKVLESSGVTAEVVRREVLEYVGPGPGLANADALATIGIDLDEVRRRVEETFGPGALERTRAGCGRLGRHIPFTPRAKKAMELALREALALRHNYIGTEHILLGLLREGQGVAAMILAKRDVTYAVARTEILSRLTGMTGT